jgi:uncharacterized protein YyaL (SSP411 family)
MAEFTGEGKYRDLAEKSLTLMSEFALRYPLGFSRWLSALENALGTTRQVAVLAEAEDESFKEMIRIIHEGYRPDLILAASTYPPEALAPAVLRERPLLNGKSAAYVCEHFVCKQPVNTPDELKAILKQE